jgi:hypothetical protein
VLTSEGHRRADLEIRNIRVAQQIDLLVDVTLRHDFIGAFPSALTPSALRQLQARAPGESCSSVLAPGLGTPFLALAAKEAASKFGLCRVPTYEDHESEILVRHAPRVWCPRARFDGAHPFVHCPTSLEVARNLWFLSPGPEWWMDRMCLDVKQPGGKVSLRWLIYSAAMKGAPYGMSLTFKPPRHDDQPHLIYFRYGHAEVDSSLVWPSAIKSGAPRARCRDASGSITGFACSSPLPPRLSSARRRRLPSARRRPCACV